ncbi:MAG: hypothetical protein Q8934_16420 [Bacillota bacterium]|nr:hypothetical protein [Bacillota bacterium]
MSENHEPLPETNQKSENDTGNGIKEEIKKEVKQEIKQEFFHLRKKKCCMIFKLLGVFLFGIIIGFFVGHHEGHDYHHGGFMMNGGCQMEMQHGSHMKNFPLQKDGRE